MIGNGQGQFVGAWTPLIIHMTDLCCFTASMVLKARKRFKKGADGEDLFQIDAISQSNVSLRKASKILYYVEIYVGNKK